MIETFMDFCSGIGGGRLGLEQAGLKCVGYSDTARLAPITYRLMHNTQGEENHGNLKRINTNLLPSFDMLIAGFPCQTFSVIGRKEGFTDDRGQIIFHLARILKETQPICFLLENVKGLTTHDKGNTLKIIFNELNEAGYDVTHKVLNSIDYGVPLLAIFLWYVQTPGQVLLEPHQVARIMSFLHPENYADSTALQTSNTSMAIGSGGLFGKGFGSNTISNVSASDVNLVSENQTDFIFSVIGEEFGFVGCVVLIIVFACLVYQCMNVAKKSGNLIGTYVAVGVACYMGFQSFINIAVATGTMPNTGQPLPFISYGLSSLMSASIAIGMVLNIYLQRKRH